MLNASDHKIREKPKFYLKTEELTTNPDEKLSKIIPNSMSQSIKQIRVSQTSNAPRSHKNSNNNKPKFQFSDFYLADLKNVDSNSMKNLEPTPKSQRKSLIQYEGGLDSFFPSLKLNNDGLMRPQQKIMDSIPNHIREFFNNRKDFNKIFDDFDKVNFCLGSVVDRVKCYRVELGNLLMKCSNTFHNVFEKLLDNSIKLYSECKIKSERQMQENLAIIDKLEREKKDLEIKNRNLKNLYNFQESEYKICKINSDALQNEIVLLHELLKKDVLSLITHLGTIENVNQKGFQTTDPSNNLALGLTDLNQIISTLEEEQSNKNHLMGDMNNLLKAMLKGGKQDAYTQLDEGELTWKPETIIKKSELHNNLTIVGAEGYSINLENKYNESLENKTNLEILKLKDREFSRNENNNEKNDLGENWNLPISLILFLENVTKQNESGRVLPWSHFKRNIFEIYADRLKYMWEMKNSLVNTFINMDEFICIYFLKTYKLRRTAEIKLLEFLVSLKYYSKIWPRATIFANLTGISQYIKGTGNESNFSYDFEAYVQEYFFFIFSKISSENIHIFDHADGQTLMGKEKLEEFVKQALFFENDFDKKRFLNKTYKFVKKINQEDSLEYIDIDKLLDALIDEYFEAKKRNFKILSKNFSKFFESDHGLLSFDDIKSIVSEVTDIPSPIPGYLYAKDLTKLRLFLYSLTSTKNKYDILNKDFLVGCSKFGIDSPFPFLSVDKNSAFNVGDKGFFGEIKELNKLKSQVLVNAQDTNDRKLNSLKGELEDRGNNLKIPDDTYKTKDEPLTKMDTSSSMFAQHFSILRELRHYCLQLKDAIRNENDLDVVWKHMDNIINILEVGCQFLNFPIQIN